MRFGKTALKGKPGATTLILMYCTAHSGFLYAVCEYQ
jgi:hypothetical protein